MSHTSRNEPARQGYDIGALVRRLLAAHQQAVDCDHVEPPISLERHKVVWANVEEKKTDLFNAFADLQARSLHSEIRCSVCSHVGQENCAKHTDSRSKS